MTINEMYVEAFKDMPINKELTRRDIIKIMQGKFGVAEDSILPSDVCYNSSNKGVEGVERPRIFVKVKRGVYKYVGTTFDASSVNPHEFGTQ